MGLTPRGTLPSMRPAFAPGRNLVGRPQALVGPNLATGRTRRREFEACNISSHLCEFNNRHAHLEIRATTMSTETMIAVAAALVLGAGTAAVAMINYEANVPLAAFAPQNDPAAVSAQNPVAGCDTDEASIFQGQWPLHY
jgi:hypothetical protein